MLESDLLKALKRVEKAKADAQELAEKLVCERLGVKSREGLIVEDLVVGKRLAVGGVSVSLAFGKQSVVLHGHWLRADGRRGQRLGAAKLEGVVLSNNNPW